jgi:hypothetical protein
MMGKNGLDVVSNAESPKNRALTREFVIDLHCRGRYR